MLDDETIDPLILKYLIFRLIEWSGFSGGTYNSYLNHYKDDQFFLWINFYMGPHNLANALNILLEGGVVNDDFSLGVMRSKNPVALAKSAVVLFKQADINFQTSSDEGCAIFEKARDELLCLKDLGNLPGSFKELEDVDTSHLKISKLFLYLMVIKHEGSLLVAHALAKLVNANIDNQLLLSRVADHKNPEYFADLLVELQKSGVDVNSDYFLQKSMVSLIKIDDHRRLNLELKKLALFPVIAQSQLHFSNKIINSGYAESTASFIVAFFKKHQTVKLDVNSLNQLIDLAVDSGCIKELGKLVPYVENVEQIFALLNLTSGHVKQSDFIQLLAQFAKLGVDIGSDRFVKNHLKKLLSIEDPQELRGVIFQLFEVGYPGHLNATVLNALISCDDIKPLASSFARLTEKIDRDSIMDLFTLVNYAKDPVNAIRQLVKLSEQIVKQKPLGGSLFGDYKKKLGEKLVSTYVLSVFKKYMGNRNSIIDRVGEYVGLNGSSLLFVKNRLNPDNFYKKFCNREVDHSVLNSVRGELGEAVVVNAEKIAEGVYAGSISAGNGNDDGGDEEIIENNFKKSSSISGVGLRGGGVF